MLNIQCQISNGVNRQPLSVKKRPHLNLLPESSSGQVLKEEGTLRYMLGAIPSQCGFTLIELIVVFSIIAVISSIGLAGFTSFTKEHVMDTTVQDIKSMLNSARDYTYSQLNTCGTSKRFSGYRVYFCKTDQGTCNSCTGTYTEADKPYYELDILCDGDPTGLPIQYKKLPANITISAPLCKSYSFQPITNVVTTSDNTNSITVSYDNTTFTKTISVSQLGVIQ